MPFFTSAFDLLQRGGPVMWVILLVSLTVVALIFERTYVLWGQYRLRMGPFLDQLIDLLEDQQHSRALELCTAAQSHPLAAMAKATLLHAGGTAKERQRALEAAALQTYPQVVGGTAYLHALANIATLLGLLGTVVGMIQAFWGVADADAMVKQEILARGIGVAMFTTAFGLIAAIPAVTAGAIFHNKQTKLLTQMEASALELLNYLNSNPPHVEVAIEINPERSADSGPKPAST